MERWGPSHHFDARSHFNITLNTSSVNNEVPWTSTNTTRKLIQSLQLAQVQSIRTMHLTLGAFSLALVLLTVHRIISDARRVSAVQVPLKKPGTFHFLANVHPAETFPLVLACGAVIQQIIFVAVQSTTLHSVLSDHCRGLAMVTFPAIFLMGYVTLVFGFEMAIRAYRRERFAPRGKWSATICIAVVAFMLLLTWIPTVAAPMFDRCFGSLIWFTTRYELFALVILSVIVFSFLLLAALISIQLMRTPDVDPNERISASRMCYYLLINALLYILVIPVEVQAHLRDFLNTLATSRIAEVSLFSSGMVIAFAHLFLRVNASLLVIKPMGAPSAYNKQKRPKIRFFGPSDLEMNISGPLALQGPRPDSRQGLIEVGDAKNRFEFPPDYFNRPEKQAPFSPGSMNAQPVDPTKWPLPPDPLQPNLPESKDGSGLHRRNKSNYSLFPTRAEEIPRLPATVYSPPRSAGNSSSLAVRRQERRSSLADAKSVTDVGEAFNWLEAPKPLFANGHRRDMSTDSSATVQIGLRFSLAPAALGVPSSIPSPTPEVPRLKREDTSSTDASSLNLPIQDPSHDSATLVEPFPFPQLPPATVSPSKGGPGKTPAFPVINSQNSGNYLQSQREKILPPTPRSALPGPPPASQPPLPKATTDMLNALRMNPVSPALPRETSPTRAAASPSPTPSLGSTYSSKSASTNRSPTQRSPNARIPLGAGTMARSPPPDGWI